MRERRASRKRRTPPHGLLKFAQLGLLLLSAGCAKVSFGRVQTLHACHAQPFTRWEGCAQACEQREDTAVVSCCRVPVFHDLLLGAVVCETLLTAHPNAWQMLFGANVAAVSNGDEDDSFI